MKVFCSYHFANESFVGKVAAYLERRSAAKVYFYSSAKRGGSWAKDVKVALRDSVTFIFFQGTTLGQEQHNECSDAAKRRRLVLLKVRMPGASHNTVGTGKWGRVDPIVVKKTGDGDAMSCAEEIARRLKLKWAPFLDLPKGYPFAYEKQIISEYTKGRGRLSPERVAEGCPETWPHVRRAATCDATKEEILNPVDPKIIGKRRKLDDSIVVDVRSYGLQPSQNKPLTFLEAGPREYIRVPRHSHRMNVGILVSGGIAPGINSVIWGIVERHDLYMGKSTDRLRIFGYMEGFNGLLRPGKAYRELSVEEVRKEANRGGSILSTSRADELLDQGDPAEQAGKIQGIVQRLADDDVAILYIIGGDGSMKAAHAIATVAEAEKKPFSVVGVPKTMDNDILWVWQSFGFLSAVEKAREFIQQLHTEARSNPRLCIVQLFGSDSGFVVSHAALASGVCDLALIPEVEFSLDSVARKITKRLRDRYDDGNGEAHGMIVMAETAIPTDVEDHLNDLSLRLEKEERDAIRDFCANGRRVSGQTPDALRTGGLKVLSRVLQRKIKTMGGYWKGFRTFTSEPRHLLRSLRPSAHDVIFGNRLGSLAVDNAMAGFTDFMVSYWLTEYVLVPLQLVTLGRKRVKSDGIFWKSVLSSTDRDE